jgi:hypothetical protein
MRYDRRILSHLGDFLMHRPVMVRILWGAVMMMPLPVFA